MNLRRLNLAAVCTRVGAATCALLCVQSANAQSAGTLARAQGVMVGGFVSGTSVTGDFQLTHESGIRSKRTQGPGGGLMLGWGFSKWFSLYAAIDRATIEVSGRSYCHLCDPLPGANPTLISRTKYVLWNRDIVGQFNVPITKSSLVPYARLAYTYRTLKSPSFDELSLTGAAVSTGAGVEYFLNANIALDAGLQFTHGPFNTRHYGDEKTIIARTFEQLPDNDGTRVNVGVKFYPHFGRK